MQTFREYVEAREQKLDEVSLRGIKLGAVYAGLKAVKAGLMAGKPFAGLIGFLGGASVLGALFTSGILLPLMAMDGGPDMDKLISMPGDMAQSGWEVPDETIKWVDKNLQHVRQLMKQQPGA